MRENVLLRDYTTFHIGGPARYFVEVKNLEELKTAVAFAKEKKLPILIMGDGSNMLVSDRGFDGVVIRPNFRGFEIDGETVRIAASENWDACAQRIVAAGLWGIENLSFVPGTAAGLAIQNVGAYGTQASDIIESVAVYDLKLKAKSYKLKADCKFEYRRSVFNTEEKGRYVILSLLLKLSKNSVPNTSYGVKADSLQGMREAIIATRKSKGQDTSEYWSAGSFFKNPIITEKEYATLPPGTPRYPVSPPDPLLSIRRGALAGELVKVPAGYLLDKICHLKGLAIGGAKLSELQVINIINTGEATAQDVLNLFKKARKIVYQKTGITLENEPELVGFE